MDSDDCLGAGFNTEHDHKAEDDKEERRENIDDIAKTAPDGQKRTKAGKTGALSVNGFT